MSKKPSLQYIGYKSNYPINIYLLVLLPLASILLTIIYGANLLGMLVYLPVLIILFYVFFSRYSAIIEVNSAMEMNIYYIFPWNKNVSINLNHFNSFDYARGFYNPIDDRRLGYFNFLRRCYDLIILYDADKEIQTEFKVNLRISSFKKVILILNKEAQMNLIKLKSPDNITW